MVKKSITKPMAILGVFGLLSGCIETTGSERFQNSIDTVNSAKVEGSYRFQASCDRYTGSSLVDCQRSGLSINHSGKISGGDYFASSTNDTYALTMGPLRSSTRMVALLGVGNRKVLEHTANVSGTVTVLQNGTGVTIPVSGTVMVDDVSRQITLRVNSRGGRRFYELGNFVSSDNTTYMQRSSDALTLKNERNAREIQQSRQAAAAVGAIITAVRPSATTLGQSSTSVGQNANAGNRVPVPTATACLRRHPTRDQITNTCGYPVLAHVCAPSGQTPRKGYSTSNSICRGNKEVSGYWLTSFGGVLQSGEQGWFGDQYNNVKIMGCRVHSDETFDGGRVTKLLLQNNGAKFSCYF